MAELIVRAGRALGLLSCAAILAACSAPTTSVSPGPAHPTAVGACTEALGDGWQVAVEMDRNDSSVLALVWDDSVATCQTWSDAARTDFGNTVTSVGRHPAGAPGALSYLTSSRTGRLAPFLVGRVPPSASAVRVSFADGSALDASVGGGVWLAWPDRPSATEPTLIKALDRSGSLISQLADPDGIQPAG